MMMFWDQFETFLGYKLPIQLINILNNCGFDNEISISEMNSGMIAEIESFQSKTINTKFEFLPGHRALLLGLPRKVQEYNEWNSKNKTTATEILNSKSISFLMKEVVKTAIHNENVDPKRRRYSESIKNFSIFLYMMCGRACYEIISANLPLPQPTTISMHIHVIIVVFFSKFILKFLYVYFIYSELH